MDISAFESPVNSQSVTPRDKICKSPCGIVTNFCKIMIIKIMRSGGIWPRPNDDDDVDDDDDDFIGVKEVQVQQGMIHFQLLPPSHPAASSNLTLLSSR